MLTFLVSSKGRRRLLTLLWADHASGTATELAKRTRVSFTTAYRELQSMKRWELVCTVPSEAGEVFTANTTHPQAGLLAGLVTPAPARPVDPRVSEARAHLAQAGAPLRAELPTTPRGSDEDLVLETLQVVRRDPEIARALPVFLARQHHGLDLPRLAARANQQGTRHLLGFFLVLTARLANDPALARRARTLRDRRVKNQELFLTTSTSRTRLTFPLARVWGLRMRAGVDWFESLFRKFIPTPAST
jgi:hypothetical protein